MTAFAVAPGSSSERFEKHRADDKGGESNKVICMPFPLDVRPVLKTETVAPCFDEIEAAVLNTCLTPMGKGAHKDGVPHQLPPVQTIEEELRTLSTTLANPPLFPVSCLLARVLKQPPS